jgi:hypothetical protein
MPYVMYVALQGDDKLLRFTMDTATGKLTPQGEVAVPGRIGNPKPLFSPRAVVRCAGNLGQRAANRGPGTRCRRRGCSKRPYSISWPMPPR